MTRMLNLLLRLPRTLLTAVCTALILYLTLVPKPLPDNDIQFWEHTDKIVHAIMFGALYVCAAIDLWRGIKASLRQRALLAAAVSLFGGAIEIAQQAMAMGRGGSLGDWCADIAGTLLAAALMQKISRQSA